MSNAGEFRSDRDGLRIIAPARAAIPPALGGLSQAEQDVIAGAFARALEVGAPGLSVLSRRAIIGSAMIRVRHHLGAK